MSGEPAAKRMRMPAPKVVGTHNGTFHCDEALAVLLLRHTKDFKDASVKRSRDPAVLETCDIVVDVGAVYDPAKHLYDHHQRGFEEVFGHGFVTKLSSAGLVYKHFGQEIIRNRYKDASDATITTLWLKMYREFIEAIDAIDNGISQYDTSASPKYRGRTDLSSRVGHLNPAWNEPADAHTSDAKFQQAVALTGQDFFPRLDYYAKAWMPARELLVEAVRKSREQVDQSGRIILFDTFLPWKEHLFEMEASQTEEPTATYVVYPDETGGNWRIQAVPVSPESFSSRKALPEAWRGLRDDALSKETGVDGGIFIHASGFIGGNQTKEGALKLATMALDL